MTAATLNPQFRHLEPRSPNSQVPVAFVTTSVGIGGAERLLVELITRIDRTRFEPVLVCLKERQVLGDQLAAAGVRVYAKLSRGRLDFRVLGRLVDVFRSESIGVACTVGTGGDRSFWGRMAARLAGVPVVVSCPHSMGVPDTFERSNRLLSGITDAFVAIAHRQKSYLVQREGFSAGKVEVIHNGVDLDRFAPGVADPALRASWGIPAAAPLAGLVALLRPEKSVETFLEAAASVHRVLPDAHFVIVGDGPERARLESLADARQLRSVVRFTGMCRDVRVWLRSIDALLLTSRMEAFPVSLLEAMACGKPVIAPRVGAIPEMVVSGETGWLVSPGDTAEFAAALGRVLGDPEQARTLGRHARAHVAERFSLTAMVRGYERLFLRLLEKNRRRVWRVEHQALPVESPGATARSGGRRLSRELDGRAPRSAAIET